MSVRYAYRCWTYVLTAGLAALVLSFPKGAYAHVGSKDVFEQVSAGPYKLFVTIRPPTVIPGVALVEVRSYGAPVTALSIAPTPLTGEASKHPPTPDAMTRSATDVQFFTGSVWIMASGSWEVRFGVEGGEGRRQVAVPVPAVSLSVLRMQGPMGWMLGVLGLVLALGAAGIFVAAVGQARLQPGAVPDATRRRRALMAGGLTLLVVAVAVALGNKWWNVEAADYAGRVYRPLDMHPALSGNMLHLLIGYDRPETKKWKVDRELKLLPDHGHLMHLYAIRWPEMDAVYHLHPEQGSPGQMSQALPAMKPGTYRLYGDIVTRTGFPVTLTAELQVPAGLHGGPLEPEDASAEPPALSQGMLGTMYKLPDGYTMVWERPAVLSANTAYAFHFRLLDPQGKPAAGMQPYLGMAGHAAFVRADGSTFAHTHPDGSAAMPAMMLANGGMSAQMSVGMTMDAEDVKLAPPVGPEVDFPYGFPAGGRYRIFIQMKHAGVVETGVFDAEVRQ